MRNVAKNNKRSESADRNVRIKWAQSTGHENDKKEIDDGIDERCYANLAEWKSHQASNNNWIRIVQIKQASNTRWEEKKKMEMIAINRHKHKRKWNRIIKPCIAKTKRCLRACQYPPSNSKMLKHKKQILGFLIVRIVFTRFFFYISVLADVCGFSFILSLSVSPSLTHLVKHRT